MRTYKIKDKEHFVYDLESELPEGLMIVPDWKNSRDGDWVRADDDAYIQILKRKILGKIDVVQTCIGTYPITGKMDTSERKSRYSLNGKSSYDTLKDRKKPTGQEVQFASKVVRGENAIKAYMDVYDANSKDYAKKRAALLLKTERINTLMNPTKEELTKVFSDLDVDLQFLIKYARDEVKDGKNGSDRLNALKMLWEAFGVVEKRKITEIAGIFQGFDKNKLEEIKRPELPEYGRTGDEAI